MRNTTRQGAIARFLLATLAVLAVAADDERPARLGMSKPVICRKIHGFASFEPTNVLKFTPDDKVSIYYEPTGYKIETTKTGFRAVFRQDGRLRRKGSKDAVWKKDNMFEYEATSKTPPYQVYLKTDIGLKGVPPGDYELDLTLHDGLAKDAALTKTVEFKVVVAPEDPKGVADEPADTPVK